MAALITKNLKLYYDGSSTSTPDWVQVQGVLSVPELGGSKTKLDCTTLSDSAHVYVNGLDDYGDELAFECNYLPSVFQTLEGFGDAEKNWKVEIPDSSMKTGSGAVNSYVTFSGQCAVRFGGGAADETLKYTLAITPSSAMEFYYTAQ